MKMLMCSLAMSLGVLASSVKADQTVIVDGEVYFLSQLTANCQSIVDDPAEQIACFNALSQMLNAQPDETQVEVPVTETLAALRAVAEYQDEDTGLLIVGSDCNVQTLYFGNYFHISRRNISEIDLFSATFDASLLQADQIVRTQGTQAPLSKGFMQQGANAIVAGGMVLESAQQNFAPRSAGLPIDAYAKEVVAQIAVRQEQAFDFVLVHPNRSEAGDEIWAAFDAFVASCQ